MRSTAILRMQPSSVLRLQPSSVLRMRPTQAKRYPVPKDEHAAHTISQRLRSLKRIPVELLPLGLVLGVAIGAAAYSSIHKLLTDKTLRLKRSGKKRTTEQH